MTYSASQHDDAITRWRSGQMPDADLLRQLDLWLASTSYPRLRQRIVSDQVAVASRAGLDAQAIAYSKGIAAGDLLPYAVRALIDSRDYAGAAGAIEARARRPDAGLPGQQAELLELRGALAEALGDPAAALLHYEDLLALQPEHRYARRAKVFMTARLSANTAALAAAQSQPGLFSPLEIASLRQGALGERLRWAVSERDLLVDSNQSPRRFDALDVVIRDGAQLNTELVAAHLTAAASDRDEWRTVRQRLAADRVVAQFERGQPAQTLALYAELIAQFGDAPYYAKASAAGAHAQLRQPEQAVPLYEAALREGGDAVRVPSDIHVGLVYAYLDTARFKQADALLDAMLARTPPLLRLSPERGRPNDDYGDLLGLRALVALYTDRPARAEHDFNLLSSLAPLNAGYRVGQARTLRLRQHPEAAAAAFEEILTDHPESVDAQSAYAETLFDTGELGNARKRVDALASTYPENTSVRGAVRTRDTVMAPRLEIDAGTGRDGGTLSNRDASIEARLSSGWFDDQWRVFYHQWLGSADVGAGGNLHHARGGLGLQWRKGKWDAQGEITQASSGPHRSGIAAGLQYRVSDAWRIGARYDSNTVDVPWRARQAGIAAREVQANAAYIVNESRRFDAQLSQRNYSDGNQRTGAGVAWRERWISGPRFQFETTLGADSGRNRLQSGPYFSPARESALTLNTRSQWLTWKRDDRTLHQVVEAGAGRYREAGFGTGRTTQLRYAHEWNWGAGWQLRYGIGTSLHPYNGVRERRNDLFIHFSMPFL